MLLVAATFGSFLESLGGSGYDAANSGTRISALTTLHGIALPFGALVMAAVPLALITGVVALITSVFAAPQARSGLTLAAPSPTR